jgi:hypothetical protein
MVYSPPAAALTCPYLEYIALKPIVKFRCLLLEPITAWEK